MTEKISVIIPIYNVEEYLRRCLDSVLGQTYQNLEIILVDDGSPDGCPAICDEYAARDPRIRVIHKPNGGLSDARNAGLDIAAGQWIGFVDSDDYLSTEMYEKLMEAMARTGSDMAVCNYCFTDGEKTALASSGVEEELVFERDDAIRLLLEDGKFQNYVWNKLYRAEYWRDIRFPVGKAFEDIDTTWRLVDRARRVVLTPFVGYYYLVRKTGIVQSKKIKNEIDCVEQGLSRYAALIGRFPECGKQMQGSILHTITKVWGIAWENRALVREKYQPTMEKFAAFAREHLEAAAPEEKLGITGRLTLRLLPYARTWAYWLAHMLHRVYLLRHPEPVIQ